MFQTGFVLNHLTHCTECIKLKYKVNNHMSIPDGVYYVTALSACLSVCLSCHPSVHLSEDTRFRMITQKVLQLSN